MLNGGSHHHAPAHVSSHMCCYTRVMMLSSHLSLSLPRHLLLSCQVLHRPQPVPLCFPVPCVPHSVACFPYRFLFPHSCRDPVFPAAIVKEAMLSLMRGFDIFVRIGCLYCMSLSLGPPCLWFHSWFCTSAFACNAA